MTVLEEEIGETKEERSFTNLYVKCFPPHFKEQDLSELFGGFGPIQAVKVMTDGRGRSFGFVNFEQHEDAKTCIQEMHRKDLRPRKEQKEAKRLEAEGKAPAVKFDVDGHPEHLLYVGRAQSKEERAAMFQKQYGDKGAPKGGATPKGKGKGGGTVFYSNGKGGTETLPETQSVEAIQSSSDVSMPYSASSSGNGWSMQQQMMTVAAEAAGTTPAAGAVGKDLMAMEAAAMAGTQVTAAQVAGQAAGAAMATETMETMEHRSRMGPGPTRTTSNPME
eukprot:CAMPEP_0197636650 /NCGR_PEP_ID=MMETSP1338-20131121/12092_1 /TAXON_ID=43686 ORGANISM="Pelagodinium beii, Strain RCC1491" /NCGR_SAMPLE_ID=MMETSP1338 /ASSEMBLY_ACC=CAM_ASM_000754 /LENGTH=276 /DNA_ID=CAMNT_0043208919 /DNA_START=6 /DNA_END=837 /DNA_ORIENTATION=+